MPDIYVECHDGEEIPVCVGQWCCGCKEHPIGKPWGWNHGAWARHNITVHGAEELVPATAFQQLRKPQENA